MNQASPKSRKRLIARVLFYSVFGLVLVAAGAYGILNTTWFRQRLEQRIVHRLEDLTGARVELNGFGFRPFVLQVQIGELVIHGTEPAGASPLFSAQHVEVEINPTALVHRRFVLRRLQWRSAQIHLMTSPQGGTNLPGPNISLLSQEAMNDLIDLSVHDLVLSHTDLLWNNRQIPLDVVAKEAGLNLRLSSPAGGYLGTFACSTLSVQAPHWAIPTSTFTGQFELARSGAKLSSVVWRSAGLSGQGSLDFHLLAEPTATATYQLKGDAGEVAKYFRLAGIESGEIELTGQAVYQRGSWASSGRFSGHRLAIRSLAVNPGPMDVSGDFLVNAERAEVSNLVLSALGGRFTGEVERQVLAKPEFRARLKVEGLDLSETLGAIPSFELWRRFSRLGGRISGTTETSWNAGFEHLQSKFDLRILSGSTSASPAGMIPASGAARGTATSDGTLAFNITQASLGTPRSQFQARGNLSNDSSDLRVTLSSDDFEEWRPLAEHLAGMDHPIALRLNSQATFTGALIGPSANRELHGRLQMGEFEFYDTHWNSLSAEVSVHPEGLRIIAGQVHAGASSAGFTLDTPLNNWAWTPAQPLTAQLRTEDAETRDLAAAIGLPWQVSGPMTGRLDVKGSAAGFDGNGEVAIRRGAFGPMRFDSLTTAVRVAPSEVRLDNLRVLLGGGNVSGLASYNFLTRAVTADLQGQNFSLSEMHFLGAGNPEEPAMPSIGGLASFELKGGGVLPKLNLSANWKVDAFELQGSLLGTLSGRLDWEGNSMRLEGRSEGTGGTLAVGGEAQTGGDWPLDLSGEFTHFEVGSWIRSFLNGRFNAQVTAGGSFRLHGPLARPSELTVRSRIDKLSVHVADLQWTNAQPIDADYAHEELAIGKFQMLGPSTAVEVAGKLKFGEARALDVSASGQADAKLLDLVDPKLQATGVSRLTLHATGSPADPAIRGRLDVEGLSLSYGSLPFHVSDLNGPIELEGDRATATALRGRSGGGTITLSGFATFAERPRFDIRAALDDVRVRYPFDFTSLLGGNLRLAGTSEGGRLSGELQVRQMFASESFNVLTLLSAGSNALAPPGEAVSSPLAANIRLGVEVASTPSVRLETHDLRLTADLDMRLQGTLARPVETGAVHILSGEALVRGNRYKLDRGDITLTNPLRTEAVLDLEATTRIEHYDLTLNLSGPLDRVKIAYRSDPPLAVGDILSLLALGYVHEESEMSTARSQQAQTVGASALLSEALSSQMTGRLQRLFGVSRVKVDPNVGGATNASGARITVEQEVTRDLTLTYITNTATSQQRIIQFEWSLSENISLVGVRDQNGIFGLELKFRRRFK